MTTVRDYTPDLLPSPLPLSTSSPLPLLSLFPSFPHLFSVRFFPSAIPLFPSVHSSSFNSDPFPSAPLFSSHPFYLLPLPVLTAILSPHLYSSIHIYLSPSLNTPLFHFTFILSPLLPLLLNHAFYFLPSLISPPLPSLLFPSVHLSYSPELLFPSIIPHEYPSLPLFPPPPL